MSQLSDSNVLYYCYNLGHLEINMAGKEVVHKIAVLQTCAFCILKCAAGKLNVCCVWLECFRKQLVQTTPQIDNKRSTINTYPIYTNFRNDIIATGF